MKNVFFIISCMFITIVNAGEVNVPYMLLPIVEIHDGDTIKSILKGLPEPLNHMEVRVLGIDTPEMPAPSYKATGKLDRAKCVKEAELALKARDFVIDIAKGQTKMKITNFSWDKFARIDADVNINGKDIKTELLKAGLAKPYFGIGSKPDWCN
jgi:micrococcal nuclease